MARNKLTVTIEEIIEEDIQATLQIVREAISECESCCLDDEADVAKFLMSVEKHARKELEL